MKRTNVGIVLAVATALISGVSIFINGFAVRQVPDAALFTTLKNGVAAVILLGLLLAWQSRRAQPIAIPDRRSGVGLLVVGLIGGSIPFLLFFSGLAMASAPSAAFIHKTLFVWVALLAVPLLGERLGLIQIGALGVLLVSQLLIVPPTGVNWGLGETMIATATLLWAAEVVLAKRLLQRIEPLALGSARLGIGLAVLMGYLVVTGRAPLLAQIGVEQWLLVALTGALLAGYVGTWLAALQRAPATVVTSVLVLGAPITALLDGLVRGTTPATLPLIGYGLIIGAAVVLVSRSLRPRRAPSGPAPAGVASA